jgi:putrescine transport system ATP-binding protein
MAVTIGVRPEKIMISFTQPPALGDGADNGAVTGIHNCAKGKLVDWAYLGSYTVYHIKLDSGLLLKATIANIERFDGHQAKFGETVFASWRPENIVVLTQ